MGERDELLTRRSLVTNSKPASGRENATTLVVIALLVLYMLGFTAFAFRLIGDRHRGWQYGPSPYIPAQSYASTEATPPSKGAPKQVELPPPTIQRKGQ
jgi:hypothetical protein